MVRQRIIYFLALAGSLVFYLVYQQWFAWVFMLTVLFFPWLSLLLSIGAMKRLRMELDVAAMVPMGSTEKINLKVSSQLPLPPYKSKLLITKPITAERWKWKPGVQLPTDHCGQLQVQLHKPGVFDYLGIFRLKIKDTGSQTVYIMPEPVEMEIPATLQKHLEPHWKRKPGGGFGENHDIRQYQPGDNLNQIHWKLSAKVGELMLREPMVPERGLMLLTMDLNGTPAELDRKLGQLLWLGQWLLEREIFFDVRVLTANGIEHWTLQSEEALDRCILSLLGTPLAQTGSVLDVAFKATWRHHIGGEQDEA